MSYFHSRASFAFLMTVLPGIPFLPSAAQADPPPAYTPAVTTVAILPVENLSKGRDENMKAKQTDRGTQAVSAAFAQRGFKLADPLAVSKAIQDSRLDLSSSAFWTPENLAALGSRSAADLVVLLVITDTHQGFRHGLFTFLSAQREGEAKTKFWVVDARTHSALIDGKAAAGKSQASALAGWAMGGVGEGSSAYTLKAVDDAVNKSLSDFLKPYPKQDSRFARLAVPTINPQTAMPSIAVPATASVRTVASTVHTAAPMPVPAPPLSQFTFLNGSLATGTLISFDGSTYTVSTSKGMRRFRAAGIKSIQALGSATAAQR